MMGHRGVCHGAGGCLPTSVTKLARSITTLGISCMRSLSSCEKRSVICDLAVRSYQLLPPRMSVFMPLLDAHSHCKRAISGSHPALLDCPPFKLNCRAAILPGERPQLSRRFALTAIWIDTVHGRLPLTLAAARPQHKVRPRIATLFVNRSHRIDQALPSNHSDHRLLYRDDSAANRRPSCNTKKENPTNLLHSCAYNDSGHKLHALTVQCEKHSVICDLPCAHINCSRRA